MEANPFVDWKIRKLGLIPTLAIDVPVVLLMFLGFSYFYPEQSIPFGIFLSVGLTLVVINNFYQIKKQQETP